MKKSFLKHYGIKLQRWGVRRYQNPDGSLTEEGKLRYYKKDLKWAKKNRDKVYKTVYDISRKELNDYVLNDLNKRQDIQKYTSNNKLSFTYINEFNKKMANVMTKNASDIKTPFLNQSIQFVAKRGTVGAELVIAEQQANVQEIFKNGVYSDGRLAYKKIYADRA